MISEGELVEHRRTLVSHPRLPLRWLLIGLATLLAAFVAGVLIGPAALSPAQVLRKLFSLLPFAGDHSGMSQQQSAILLQIRLPRVVLAGVVGATLASSGGAYQGAFRNALADPYLLGAASGAGLGATIAIAYGGARIGSDLMPAAAFLGALVAVGLAYIVGRSGSEGRTATSLILAGIAVASFFTAIQTFLQQRRADTLREVYSWILGRLSTAGWSDVVLILPYVLIGWVVVLSHRRMMDVLALGDDEAESLGLNARRIRLTVVVAASLATAAAVAVSGLIGFVGIIVPHLIRLFVGTSYRVILPMTLVLGAAFLILTDVLGRSIASPAELPIGVVTAFFGAPFFALVLRRSRRPI